MSRALEWTTNAQGLLKQPHVHDGHITEVCYKMSTVTINIDGDGCNIVFTLQGVEEANLSVWSGSIVSEIIILKISDLSAVNNDTVYTLWSSLFDGQLFDHNIEGAAHRIMVRSPHSFIFVVLCSYGGTIACVANAITVSEA